LASFGIAHWLMHIDWILLPGIVAGTLTGALAMMLGFGYVGTAAALRAKPALMLRNE
jgi:putative ABC transport system permease protein